jgi:hypothetical protein
MFETENLATLGIDSRHDMPDGSIFAGSIHGLENQQNRMTVGGIQQVLQLTQLGNV